MDRSIVWVDIPTVDLDRACRFYSAMMGTTIARQEVPGMSLAVLPHEGEHVGACLYQRADLPPGDKGPLVYLSCEGRLDAAEAAVVPGGGKVLQPKHSIGPYGFRAVVLDSEGNRIALHSTK